MYYIVNEHCDDSSQIASFLTLKEAKEEYSNILNDLINEFPSMSNKLCIVDSKDKVVFR